MTQAALHGIPRMVCTERRVTLALVLPICTTSEAHSCSGLGGPAQACGSANNASTRCARGCYEFKSMRQRLSQASAASASPATDAAWVMVGEPYRQALLQELGVVGWRCVALQQGGEVVRRVDAGHDRQQLSCVCHCACNRPGCVAGHIQRYDARPACKLRLSASWWHAAEHAVSAKLCLSRT